MDTNDTQYTEISIDEIVVIQTIKRSRFANMLYLLRRDYFVYKKFKKMTRMNAEHIMDNEEIQNIFKQFILLTGEKRDVLKHVECYNLCEMIIDNPFMIENRKMQEELLKLCPKEIWENTLKRAYTFRHRNWAFMLTRKKIDSLEQIELDEAYSDFSSAIRRKSKEIKNMLIDLYDENDSN